MFIINYILIQLIFNVHLSLQEKADQFKTVYLLIFNVHLSLQEKNYQFKTVTDQVSWKYDIVQTVIRIFLIRKLIWVYTVCSPLAVRGAIMNNLLNALINTCTVRELGSRDNNTPPLARRHQIDRCVRRVILITDSFVL